MHYHNGTMLAKLQWGQTRAPGHVIGLFQTDKSGMSIKNPELRCISDVVNLGKIFVAPDGKNIKLTEEQIPYAFFAKSEGELYGRLAAYKYRDKVYIYFLDNKKAYSGYWGWLGLGSQGNASNLKQLSGSSQKGILVQIDDNCNYNGNSLVDCKCSFSLGSKQNDPNAEYTEGGRPTVVASGQDDKLPCIALPEKQEEITLEYLKTNLFHKREVHCLEDVNVEKRKELIGEIAKQTVIVGSDEDLLYNLILSTPQNQGSDVFAYLKDEDLLSSIINDTQFTTHDEITFVFIDWLRKYNVAPITDQTKLVRYNGGKIESSISKNTIELDYDWMSDIGYSTEEVNLYDYVLVEFVEGVGSYKKGSLLKLPALEAYYLFNADRRASLIKSARLTAEVGLLALGVGEIAAAYRVYQAARGAYALYLVIKASTDIGVGLTDIVIQNSLAEEWSKTSEGRARLERWNTICTWYTVGTLTASGIDLVISKYGVKTITSESKFDEICDELEGVAKGGNQAVHLSEEVISGFRNKLVTRIKSSNGFELIHTNSEIASIITEGRKLGLTDDVIDDLLYISCRTDKQIIATDLIQQMDNYVNVVLKRGYPYLFTNKAQFDQFNKKLIELLNNYNISISDIRIQGSSLRSIDAKDIDIAVFVNQIEFDKLVKAAENGIKERAQSHNINRLLNEINQQKLDGRLNSYYINRINDEQTFNQALYERVLKSNSNSQNIDLSIMVKDGRFHIQPYIKIE